jgi:hypothetical protein
MLLLTGLSVAIKIITKSPEVAVLGKLQTNGLVGLHLVSKVLVVISEKLISLLVVGLVIPPTLLRADLDFPDKDVILVKLIPDIFSILDIMQVL